MAISFAFLLVAAFAALILTCLALFGRAERILESALAAEAAVRCEKDVDACVASIVSTDRRTALVEAAGEQFFVVFVVGQSLVVRPISWEFIRTVEGRTPSSLALVFSGFTARPTVLKLGCPVLASVWTLRLNRLLARE